MIELQQQGEMRLWATNSLADGNFCYAASSISRRALKEKSSYRSKQADDEVYTEWCVTQQAHASFLMRKPQSHQV